MAKVQPSRSKWPHGKRIAVVFVDKQGRRRTFGQTDSDRELPGMLDRARLELSDAEHRTVEVVRRDDWR